MEEKRREVGEKGRALRVRERRDRTDGGRSGKGDALCAWREWRGREGVRGAIRDRCGALGPMGLPKESSKM